MMMTFNCRKLITARRWVSEMKKKRAKTTTAAGKTVPHVWVSKPQITAEGQCDCACATALLLTQKISLGLLWANLNEGYCFPLSEQHILIFLPQQIANILVVNQSAWQTILEQSRAQEVLFEERAQSSLRNEPDRGFALAPLLSAWLHVTSACNLSCPYCYVSKNGQKMDEATGLSAVEAVFRAAQQHDYGGVKLKYAGGEPALQFPLIQKMHEHARKQADVTGLELQEVLLSNGTILTPAILDFLAQEGIRLMISLDGMDEGHAKLRQFADGSSSLPGVVHSVQGALAAGLKPYLSTTVTRLNLDSLPLVVAFALEHGLPLSLNLYRESACAPDDGTLQATPKELIASIRAALKVIEEHLPPYRFIDGWLDLISFTGPREYHCSAGQDYLVIDTQGQIARCQMTMGEVVSHIYADDPLQDVRNCPSNSVEQMAACSACPWKYYCAGGCPLLSGRSEGKSAYCEVYQAIFPELLRLEGLRLLKWEMPQV